MKKMNTAIRCTGIIIVVFLLSLSLPAVSQGAMNDFCVTPPFIVGGVTPNLLLMIDNSASMFDLTYVDAGTATRRANYCYDQTYQFGFHYEGYFKDWFIYYEYDFDNEYFNEIPAFPGACDKLVAGSLCIDIGWDAFGEKTVTRFVAEGNYLNWLSASKFDVQKKILTGGKYQAPLMIAESRGCVGRKFIKEALDQLSYVEGGVNTPLGITFGVRGPKHPYSETSISFGGTTEIDIFEGDYDEQLCGDAINSILDDENKQTITDNIEACLDYTGGKYCSLDNFIPCNNDGDCAGEAGACNIVNDGVCGIVNDGVCGFINNGICAVTTAGVCTAVNGVCGAKVCVGGVDDGNACNNNGQCDSGVCSKLCVGGGVAGSQCNNDNDCKFSSCTAGKVGNLCGANPDCDLETCTNAGPTFGIPCVVNADCNTQECTAPPAMVGIPCNINPDCNSGGGGTCTAGLVGNPCLFDTDCNSAGGTCSAPPSEVGRPCLIPDDCTTGFGVCQQPVTQQIKSTFSQSVHECYQYWQTGSFLGTNYLNVIANPSGCNQIYKEYKICNGGARDGEICTADVDCTGGGTCVNGPDHIRPGSAALVCSTSFAGYCAASPDNWDTTNWVPREYANADACITAKFTEFCVGAVQPPVVDPTDDPSTTEEYDNLPAIIADLGVENQLGQPIGTLIVNMNVAAAPAGLIQEFESLIHFGAMTFNYFGSTTECPGDIPCTKVCQGKVCQVAGTVCTVDNECPAGDNCIGTVCTADNECPAGDSCVVAANLDGGQITDEGYIQGNCSTAVATTCNKNAHCPAGEICVYDVGDHTSGLIQDIDGIFASTWTPFSEGFYNAIGYFSQRADVRINPTDFITEAENPLYRDPVQYVCQKNNVLLISDGMSTADLHPDPSLVAATYNVDGDNDGEFDVAAAGPGSCPKFAGSRNLDDIAWVAKNRNIEDFTQAPDPNAQNSQTLTTHVVFNGVATADPGECNPDELMNDTADNGGGTYARAENPQELYNALRQAFLMIAGRAASGTAASVLASGEGTGANLVQAIFYPERSFLGEEIMWTGSLKNLWYYIDPNLGNTTLREDTNQNDMLELTNDYIIHFFFDQGDNLTKARLFVDSDGDGVANSPAPPPRDIVYFENVESLWEAGDKLWRTDPAARTIYTTTNGSSRTSFEAPVGAGSPLINLLQADNEDVADKLIDYVRGVDYKACSVTTAQTCTTNFDCPAGETCEQAHFCSQSVATSCAIDADCPAGETCVSTRNRTVTIDTGLGVETHVWKLGDIINSTPRINSWVALNHYYLVYRDSTYRDFYQTANYRNKGTVYVGANDGMLHAFNLGVLGQSEDEDIKAVMLGASGSFGLEQWAYIPKNALPYLKYMADPGYCHVYSVDLTPFIFDASIGDCGVGDYWDCTKDVTKWRTILIGGMRTGGAAKDACTSDINADAVVDSDDCVITPAAGEGYSSYFALDITDANNPQLLWEFSNENIPPAELATGGLGYSTSGPAVARISALNALGAPDHTKNGRFFVVLGSGPTGPIDTATHQFKGYSDQPLKLFILDLATGQLLRTIDSGIPYAFAGSLVDATMDYDKRNPERIGSYQDDVLYFGFVKAENAPNLATQWNVGGVLRLTTKNSLDPNNWVLSKFIDTGPVTSSIAILQNYKTNEAYLYWGTGRYYFKIADVIDDPSSQRALYGVKEPCFGIGGFDETCTTTINWGDLGDATAGASGDADGWYILLDKCTDIAGTQYANCADPAVTYMAERDVTDTLATPIGAVFFTTTKPAADVCEFGGTSHLWAVKYDTGGAVGISALRGKAVMQVSTASIEEINLKDAFIEKSDAADAEGRGRRTAAFQGVPPAGAPPGILVPPDPVNKFIHIFEK